MSSSRKRDIDDGAIALHILIWITGISWPRQSVEDRTSVFESLRPKASTLVLDALILAQDDFVKNPEIISRQHGIRC
jgi:hypothetical protein